MTNRPVSIIVASYNNIKTLPACLQSIWDTAGAGNWDVIVVDDGSTDGSLEYLKKQKNIRVIQQNRMGTANAINAGIAVAGKRDFIRVHADIVIETPGWISLLQNAALEQPKAGVVGARLVFPDGRIHSVGRSIVNGLGLHDRHANRRMFQPDKDGPASIQEVDSVSGALAYYRREAYDRVGRFDPNYWPSWIEDDDYCFAVRDKNYKVYVNPQVRAIHFTPTWSPTAQPVLGRADTIQKYVGTKNSIISHFHVSYWEKKWGWDPLFPDLNEVRRLYGDTEVCWKIGASLKYQPAEGSPTVDVCLVTWNSLNVLKRCMESLAQTDYPADRMTVYVVNNGSVDNTQQYLDQLVGEFPFKLNVTHLPLNAGAQTALNWGFIQGNGEMVAKLDDDIVLPPNWLASLTNVFCLRPYAGVVGPKVLNDNDNNTIQCGGFQSFPNIYGHEDEIDTGQANYLARAYHVRGCCNLYRRDALEAIGLLDIRYSPSQYDDVDHHVALGAAGYEVIYDGRAEIIHKLSDGAARSYAAISNQQANQHKLIGKWGADIFEILDKSLDLSLARGATCHLMAIHLLIWPEGLSHRIFQNQSRSNGKAMIARLSKLPTIISVMLMRRIL